MMMRDKLDDISRESFNKFGLKVGIACGPLVCGVIGARKPVFDIWGDTVNLASRMDSTGIIGHIQVPKETAQVINQNIIIYLCDCLPQGSTLGLVIEVLFSDSHNEGLRIKKTRYN